jgi:hypothetical protein
MLTPKQVESWGPLIKRLEHFGRDGSYSVITIHILTDEMGCPALWTDPERARIEPRAGAAQMLELAMNNRG